MSKEIKEELAEVLDDVRHYYSTEYEEMKRDLYFASGDQWWNIRDQRRIKLILNFIMQHKNRIVNPVLMEPYGVTLSGSSRFVPLIQGLINDIEYHSNAQDAYVEAYENMVICGRGWLCVKTDYDNEEDLNQKIIIDSIRDPLSAFIDPFADKIDGSDAKYGLLIDYISEAEAEKKYGVENASAGIYQNILYQNWNVPDHAVGVFTYYKLEEKKVKRYWLADGDVLTDPKSAPPEELIQNQRTIKKKYVGVYQYVGDTLVHKTTMNIPWIPLVQVAGDKLFLENNERKYGGITYLAKDSQRMLNDTKSRIMERIGLAPKSPWAAAEGQIEGYEKYWAKANTHPWDVLPYKPTTINGTLVPPPQRNDNRAQIDDLTNASLQAQQDISRETGVKDVMVGDRNTPEESGRAVLLKKNEGEVSTAHYSKHLESSIKQVGRILLALLPSIYDTYRDLNVRNEKGDRETIQGDLSQLEIDFNNIDIKIASGPAYASRKKEAATIMLELARLMPAQFQGISDLFIENLDFPGSEKIVARFQKLLPPELQEGNEQPDPKAMQALQQGQQTITEQQQTIDYMEGIIRQLQAALIDSEKDRKADITETVIKSQTDLAKERIKQTNENVRLSAQIEAETQKEIQKTAQTVFKESNKTLAGLKIPPMVEGPVYTKDRDIDTLAAMKAVLR